MSFSFRNLFSQDSEAESQQPPGGAYQGQAPANSNPAESAFGPPPSAGSDPNGGMPMAPTDHPVQPEAQPPQAQGQPFSPTPQPTDQGTFEAMLSNPHAAAGPQPGGETPQGDRSAFGYAAAAASAAQPAINTRTLSVQEIIPFIPPALATQADLPTDRSVTVELSAEGSSDVKLSTIYAACPELFATEITPLNDSIVTLPQAEGEAPAAEANPFSSALTAQAQQSFANSREAGASEFRTEMLVPAGGSQEANSPFGGAAPAAEPAASAETPLQSESSFSPPPSFSLPADPGPGAGEPIPTSPFGGMPVTNEPESVPAEVLPAEVGPQANTQPDAVGMPSPGASPGPAADAGSSFGFPPPRDENEAGGGASSSFGSFENPPRPVAEPGQPESASSPQGFGFPPGGNPLPEVAPEAEAAPEAEEPGMRSPEGFGKHPLKAASDPFAPHPEPESSAQPGFESPVAKEEGSPTDADASEASSNPFDTSRAFDLPSANPFEFQPAPESVSPIDDPAEGANQSPAEPATPSGNNPFANLPPIGSGFGGGSETAESDAKSPEAQEGANPFASIPPSAETQESSPRPEMGAEAASGFRTQPEEHPAEAKEARSVSFHLRNVMGGSPQARIDPMNIPVEAMIELPVSLIEPQLASGEVSLPLGEFAKYVEPSLAGLFQAGDPAASVSLPANDLFHQIADLVPAPTPAPRPEAAAPADEPISEPESRPEIPSQTESQPALEVETAPSFGGFGDSPFSTPFSEKIGQDAELEMPAASGFAAPVSPEDDFGPGYSPPRTEDPVSGFGGGIPENPFAKEVPETREAPETREKQPEEAEAFAEPPSFLTSDPFAPLARGGATREPAEKEEDEEPVSFLEPPESATQMPMDSTEPATPFGAAANPNPIGNADAEAPAESPLPSFDALIPDQEKSAEGLFTPGGSSFFEELESNTAAEAPAAETPASPAAPFPQAQSELPPVDDEVVSDIELRAVFGVSEAFDAQKVADLTSELPGVAACVITGSLGVFQGRRGADPGFAEKAETLVRSARDFAVATGVPNAESFTIHTDQGAISVFVSGEERCLAVRHEPGGFDPGVREKLILVSRGLMALKH